MKKFKIILFALISFSFATGCDGDFEELNKDPNNPVAIPADLLLGYAQRQFSNATYGMQRGGDMGACWAQLWSKVQYNDEARYVPRRGVVDALWDNIFTLTVSEGKAMYDLAEADGNTNLQGVALVMQAIGYQTLVELYGPIPFTEAINGAILKPAYDDEATVFEGVIDLLTQASTLLSNGTGSVTASSDLYYGGDTSKWLKLANSLKFRALMRISGTRSVSSELQALVNGGNMFASNDDSAEITYLSVAPDANPIWETVVDGNRPEYKIGLALTDILEGLGDPRLEVYASPNASGDIVGKPAGFGNQTPLPNDALGYTYANISGLGAFYLRPELPAVIMSYSQLNFLMAEAANEGYISGGIAAAKEYYYKGIAANFQWNGIDPTSYIAQENLNFASQSDGRDKIATQVWISLFSQGFEAWTEWRRTKIPALLPAAEAALNEIPSRLYYPTLEPSLNKENYDAAASSIGGDLLTSSLFWQ
ncbi:SusD/RagB family nutrient-binding outer membrane lipoprotein [Algibacter luteus]|uniref:SusD/RagB family nutrient-binding outer membrane lipoprotein n=1 Tax=Algibacter luteus TaxID=1178825 RepID=UPI002591BFB5|nr:SusD/RagB family nutrient-binding outer membrane lipoprotein [Algibacter luteus]WJJ97561.1 SusD/RagB family nutrient-binding outer membrane lipoprotein [Algibacter luteus]